MTERLSIDLVAVDPSGPAEDEEIFRRAYPQLRRFAAVVADADIDPDDLVQAALVQVLETKMLRTLDNPTAYMIKTISRLVANERRGFARRRRALDRLGGTVRSATQDTYPSDIDFLASVEPIERAVLFLVDVEGFSFGDAASMIDLTPTAARARASRARRRLRTRLREDRDASKGNHG